MRFFLVLVVMLYCNLASAGMATRVLIQSPQSEDDASHQYYVDLITQVLKNTQAEYGVAEIVETGFSYTQNRALKALEMGHISVFWTGTNRKRENHYRVIHIPLMAGLLGIRVPVIRGSQLQEFVKIESPEQLKSLTACQGTHWPDSDILEGNGYRVERVTKFESMYSMLRQGRCDYFPRGIGEVFAELNHGSNQDMMVLDNLLFIYPMPMYIFVNKSDKQLTERLEQGLSAMAEKGEIFKFICEHASTRDVFPLNKYVDAQFLKLSNHLLPDTTQLDNPKLWIEIKSEDICF